MKKNTFKKLALALGTVATVAAPIAAVVSCGSTEADSNPTTLSIVAEKSWVPTMNGIISQFKKDNADEMAKQGIKDIKVIESGAFEMADRLSTKGYKDSGVSDIVLLPGDRIQGMIEQGYIKPFTQHNLGDFAKNEISASSKFLPGAIAAAAPGHENGQDGTPGTDDDEVYAVPENVESMVAWHAGTDANDAANAKSFTVISDLWKANGFFNTIGDNAANLKDIVDTSGAGKATLNEKLGGNTKTFLKAGFKKMIEGTAYDGDMLNSSADVAAPKVQQYWAKNAGANIIAGPWEKAQLQETVGGTSLTTSLTPEAAKKVVADLATTIKAAKDDAAKKELVDHFTDKERAAIVNVYTEDKINVAKFNAGLDKEIAKAKTDGTAAPTTEKHKQNEDVVTVYGLISGSLTGDVTAVAPADYNQWAGGWNFTLNERISDAKQTVAESLIGEILKSSHAKTIFNSKMAKMSPTVEGRADIEVGLDATSDVKVMYAAAEGLEARPVAAEFGVVWGAYADTIQDLTEDITAYGGETDSGKKTTKLDALATKFAENFEAAITTALNKA